MGLKRLAPLYLVPLDLVAGIALHAVLFLHIENQDRTPVGSISHCGPSCTIGVYIMHHWGLQLISSTALWLPLWIEQVTTHCLHLSTICYFECYLLRDVFCYCTILLAGVLKYTKMQVLPL